MAREGGSTGRRGNASVSSAPPTAARYLQVKHFILEQIAAGELPAGARVPSENELTRTLGVSRMTANRAVRELAEIGRAHV